MVLKLFVVFFQESYVTEVAANKCNLLLLNKADFLTEEQR